MTLRQLASRATILVLLLASTLWSQQLATRMTNREVIDLTALGLSDDVIIAKVRSAAQEEPCSSIPASKA